MRLVVPEDILFVEIDYTQKLKYLKQLDNRIIGFKDLIILRKHL